MVLPGIQSFVVFQECAMHYYYRRKYLRLAAESDRSQLTESVEEEYPAVENDSEASNGVPEIATWVRRYLQFSLLDSQNQSHVMNSFTPVSFFMKVNNPFLSTSTLAARHSVALKMPQKSLGTKVIILSRLPFGH